MVDRTLRPDVPLTHANPAEHRRQIAVRANAAISKEAIGTDVQAWDAGLDDIAALAATDGNFIVGDGTNWVAESGAAARLSLGFPLPGMDAQSPVVASSTTTDSTTAATMQNSSLSATITPVFNDSVIEATAIFPLVNAFAVAGTPTVRYLLAEIQNATDTISSPTYRVGRELAAASAAAATSYGALVMQWRYTVNSLTARTFTARFASSEATNVEARLSGAASEATMVLREIKQ